MGDSPASKRLPTTSEQPLNHLNSRGLLLALLGQTRVRIAPDILETAWPDNLMALAHMTEHELVHALGMSLGPARRLAAALELHRRLVAWSVPVRPIINIPEDAMSVLLPVCTFPVEHFWCLALDVHCRLISSPVEVSKGDVDSTDAGPRAFFRAALRMGATSVIAAHNHPSGDLTVSAADMAVTRRLVAAGRAIDVPLADHIIITADRRWISLRRETPASFC